MGLVIEGGDAPAGDGVAEFVFEPRRGAIRPGELIRKRLIPGSL